MRDVEVLVGPRVELHDGVHHSLFVTPPIGFRHKRARCTHRYLCPGLSKTTTFLPFDHYCVDECAQFLYNRRRQQIVYSSRVPADGRVPWLLETDCLLATLIFGRDYIVGQREAVREGTFSAARARLRQRAILRRILHPSCRAIVFRTNYYRDLAIAHIRAENLISPAEQDAFREKADVIYAAAIAQPRSMRRRHRVSILFSGRVPEKGAEIAREVFRVIAERYSDRVNLFWIGDSSTGALHPKVTVMPLMDRPRYLEFLRTCDVFFSSTTSESWGAALVEAAASGLAIVTTKGQGVEHLPELFEDGVNAFLVSNSLAVVDRVSAFVRSLSKLLNDPTSLRAMSGENTTLTTRGRLSVDERNRKLGLHYAAMAQCFETTSFGQVSSRFEGFSSVSDKTLRRRLSERLGGKRLSIEVT